MTTEPTSNAIAGTVQNAGVTTSRWRKWLFAGSLALNLLLLAAIGSAAWRFGGPHRHSVANVPGNLIAYASTLPRGRSGLIDGNEFRQSVGPLRRELRDARNALFAAITAEPFNQEVYDQAQSRMFDAESRLRIQQGKFMSLIAAKLTPEERRAYLNWQEHRRNFRRRLFGRGTGQQNSDDAEPPK
jgi:hypothetical protein